LAIGTAVIGAELAVANWLGRDGLFIVFAVAVFPNCLLAERLVGGEPVSQPRRRWQWYALSHIRLIAAAACIAFVSWLSVYSGLPSVLSPTPLYAFLSYACAEEWWSLVLIPAMTYLGMNLYLGRVVVPGPIPMRFPCLLATASICTVCWFVGGWRYGLEYQSAVYFWSLAAINLAIIVCLWTLWIKKRKRASTIVSLALGLILYGWLFWLAFPWLGELP
jgi:hypothetical protein